MADIDNNDLVEGAYIDYRTGKKTATFTYKGRRCPVATLSSPTARQLAGYSLIRADLSDARDWLQSAYDMIPRPERPRRVADRYHPVDDRAPFKLIKGLWFGALVLYGKCYTKAEGRKIKLDSSNLPSEFLPTHDKVIGFRHTIVAHAGVTAHETASVKLILRPRTSGCFQLLPDIARLSFQDDREDPVPFLNLINKVHQDVHQKCCELEQWLMENDVAAHGEDYWRAKAQRE